VLLLSLSEAGLESLLIRAGGLHLGLGALSGSDRSGHYFGGEMAKREERR
jgi:hypothetical protein